MSETRIVDIIQFLDKSSRVINLKIWAIHESVITYDGHISRPAITELELGPSENSYSRSAQKVSHSCA